MKRMGGKFILGSRTVTSEECLQYALSRPASVMIHGIDKMEYLDQTRATVNNFRPLTQDRIAALTEKTKQAAMTGKYELFQTTERFDSTARNPGMAQMAASPGRAGSREHRVSIGIVIGRNRRKAPYKGSRNPRQQ